MKTMLAARIAACLWCAGGFAALPVHAGDVADMRPSADEIVRQLAPHGASRSLRGIVVERAPVRTQDDTPGPPSVNLAIQFDFSSARFTPGSRVLLDNLGHALSDDALAHARFRIVGHTDASGNPSTNLSVEAARAGRCGLPRVDLRDRRHAARSRGCGQCAPERPGASACGREPAGRSRESRRRPVSRAGATRATHRTPTATRRSAA